MTNTSSGDNRSTLPSTVPPFCTKSNFQNMTKTYFFMKIFYGKISNLEKSFQNSTISAELTFRQILILSFSPSVCLSIPSPLSFRVMGLAGKSTHPEIRHSWVPVLERTEIKQEDLGRTSLPLWISMSPSPR